MLHVALLGLCLSVSGPHPDSLSRSRLEVDGSSARLTIRFQSLSAIEVLPELDPDLDGRLAPEELAAGEDALGRYLLERWRILAPGAGSARVLAEGRASSFKLLPSALDGPLDLQWMEAHLVFEAAEELDVFTIESRLFQERNPFHRDFLGLLWRDEPEVRVLFSAAATRFEFEPESVRRPGVLGFFLGLGFRHILEGYDHLAFLLALLVAAPRLRSLVGVVTAFTLAHSITLAWAALDPDGLPARIPGRFVELAIALSIAYVAAENLMRREPHNTWIEAFGFGLLHGLGFAGFLGDALAGENLVVTALLGFNLGVEAGQLVVVVALVALFALFRSRAPEGAPGGAVADDAPAPGLVPAWFRVGASALVAVLALYWFAERAGWIA